MTSSSSDSSSNCSKTNTTNDAAQEEDYYSFKVPCSIKSKGLLEIRREYEFLILTFKNADEKADEKTLSSRISIDHLTHLQL